MILGFTPHFWGGQNNGGGGGGGTNPPPPPPLWVESFRKWRESIAMDLSYPTVPHLSMWDNYSGLGIKKNSKIRGFTPVHYKHKFLVSWTTLCSNFMFLGLLVWLWLIHVTIVTFPNSNQANRCGGCILGQISLKFYTIVPLLISSTSVQK